MISVEDFITQFHSVSAGIPEKRRRLNSLIDSDIPEKRRRFNSFIIQLNSTAIVSNELSNLVVSITPKDLIEESFRFEIMIKFNLHDIIITEFKQNSNNTLLIRKLLKNYKAFGDLFCNIDGQFFVDDILPHLSYSLKLKLLNGISKFMKNESLADEYFVKVEKKYGLKLAMNLLPACTAKLIRLKMDRYLVTLSNRQLINICKKDKEFLMYYLNVHYLKIKENSQRFHYFYAMAFKEFAKLHPEMFWKVNKDHNVCVNFGRRMTSTMFRHRCRTLEEGHKFLNNFSSYSELCKIAKKDGEIKEFLFSLFPVTHDLTNSDFWRNILRFVENLPTADQFFIVSATFQEKYGLNLLNYPEYCKELLQIIPRGLREPIMDALIENDDQLIQFYHVEKSIPFIREKLQHCGDAQERGKLMSLICKTCTVNKDKNALLEVLNYVLVRHKNDVAVLAVFFNNLMHFPGITKLDHAYWKKMADITKIFEISRPDYNAYLFYNNYLKYLIRNKISLEEYCKKSLENILNTYTSIAPNAFRLQPDKNEKIFLEEIKKYIHLYKIHKNYRVICLSYLVRIFSFNIANKRNRIDLENYTEFFDSELFETADQYSCQNLIQNGLKLYPSDEIWHGLFWKHSTLNRNNVILSWYVQKWPKKVADKLDKILSDLSIESVDKFFMEARKFLDEKAIETIKTYAKNSLYSNNYKKVKLAITIFCIIAPKALLDIILPIIEKFESNTKLPVTEFLLIKLAIKRLHKIGSPHDTLQLILRYCNRNFAICAVIPLCSIAYSTPEIGMLDELPKFTNNALCIKKTVLSLSKLILSSTDFAKIIQIFNEKETVTAIKRIMLQRAFECLNENPSEFFWNFTKNCIFTMDESDTDMYHLLMELKNVPEQYLSAYIPLIFEQLSNNPHLEIQKNKYKLLESIPTRSMNDLNIDFLKKIIKETATLKNVSNLHWNCILLSKGKQQEELFEENFKALQNFVDSHGHNLNENYDISVVISRYIYRFLDVVLDSKCTYALIQKFNALWNSIMTLYKSHHSYMLVLFVEIYAKNDCDVYKTGIEIRSLLKQYIENAGFAIISLLSNQLNEFFIKTKINKQDQLLSFVQGLLQNNEDEDIQVLVLNMLSTNTAKPHTYTYYNDVLQTIQKSSRTIVKLHLDNYLKEIV